MTYHTYPNMRFKEKKVFRSIIPSIRWLGWWSFHCWRKFLSSHFQVSPPQVFFSLFERMKNPKWEMKSNLFKIWFSEQIGKHGQQEFGSWMNPLKNLKLKWEEEYSGEILFLHIYSALVQIFLKASNSWNWIIDHWSSSSSSLPSSSSLIIIVIIILPRLFSHGH